VLKGELKKRKLIWSKDIVVYLYLHYIYYIE
jgi:hypothetical protein